MAVRHPRNTRPRTGGRRRDVGAAAVEFALIVPILVLVVGAIIDFGFIFAQQVALNNAARDAARTGVVKSIDGSAKSCQGVIGDSRAAMANTLGINNPNAVAVTMTSPVDCNQAANASALPCTGARSSDRLMVSLTYTSNAIFPLPGLNNKVLTSQGVYQCEYN